MSDISFISLGSTGIVSVQRLLSVIEPDSAPVRRMIQEARDRGTLIDASFGRKTKAVLIMDSDHIILSGIGIDEIKQQLL